MKTHWEVEVVLYAFLASALDEGEWSALRLGRFTPRERAQKISGLKTSPLDRCFEGNCLNSEFWTVRQKVKLSLCPTKHHAMNTWGSGGIIPRIINIGTRWR